jgi:hypothetical protein
MPAGVFNVNSTMSSTDQLLIEAKRVRDSGVLGDARLRQLFDYLLEKTVAGESPKELVIAMDVFGKGADFSVGEDALVRVYVHKLRKALSSFYGSAAASGGYALQLPKGDYRLHLQIPPADVPGPGADTDVGKGLSSRRVNLWRVGCFILGAVAIALLLFAALENRNPDGLADVRRSPVWSDLLTDGRPITIVIGDYYLLGETDDSLEVKRLVREFDINSRADFDHYRMQHPDDARHLVDVGFRYLPTASASALRHVMAVLAPADRRISVRMMSELPVSAFKSSDVIYIGFVSGMGMLQDTVFKGSRLNVGFSYDELIDATTGHSYVSQEVSQVQNDENAPERRSPYHDYGLFAKLRGPAGNVLMIIAGTRDEGVEETSEELTNHSSLTGITSQIDATKPFEGLLEVGALEGVDMSGRLIFVAPRTESDVTAQESKAASSPR